MARALTQAQVARRSAIVEGLRGGESTVHELCSFLDSKGIFVGVDTVRRDLMAMVAAGTLQIRFRTRSGRSVSGERWAFTAS